MKEDKKIEKENAFVSFYRNYKILVWLLIIIIAIILIIMFAGNGKDKSKSTDNNDIVQIVIEQGNNVSVTIGNTISLSAKINVDDATIDWKSSNNDVAQVENGKVTGISYGTATITATYVDVDDKKYTSECDVTVIDGNPNVTLDSVDFEEGDLYIAPNNEYQLKLILDPSDAEITEKSFVSSDENIVMVSETGKVKAKHEGHARVIVTINGKYKASIDVYVRNSYKKAEIVLSPTSISIDSAIVKIKVGDTYNLSYTVNPSNTDKSKLAWSSSDSSVVSVDQNGKITAKKLGKAIISIKSVNGKSDEVPVEVLAKAIPVEDIVLSVDKVTVEKDKSVTISPTVLPSDATDKSLTYSLKNTKIASVKVNGAGETAVITGLKEGSTDLTITSSNVEKKITVKVIDLTNDNGIDEDNKSSNSIKVESNKNNLARTYEEALKIPVEEETTITVTFRDGVKKIKYCIYKYGTNSCTPNIELRSSGTIKINKGGLYVLRIVKYDKNGNELTSSSSNYINGSLNYYINTGSTYAKQYTITGVYDTEILAKAHRGHTGDKVMIKVNDSARHLSICSIVDSTCNPSIRINSSYTINLNKEGLWRIVIDEYDKNNNLIGNRETYYVYIKDSDEPSDEFKVSNLNVLKDDNGKYLSVDVESDDYFSVVRFCYTVVNANELGTCNLDLVSRTVSLHNGVNVIHPKEENQTNYAEIGTVKNKTLAFYIDAINTLYDSNDTNKDIIFEFAIKTDKGFSLPIKIRVHMVSKSGNDSYWSATFVR